MKEKFERTYDELYQMYPDGYFLHRFAKFDNALLARSSAELRDFYARIEVIVEAVRTEIQDFEIQNRWPFRADAKYFLVTNFNNMIIKPIVYSLVQGDAQVSELQLRDYVVKDVRTIMQRSLEIRKERLISGHDILKAIDTLWPQLQSTSLELWG